MALSEESERGANLGIFWNVARGKVKVVAETYKLGEVTKAYRRVAGGKVRFRAVIVK